MINSIVQLQLYENLTCTHTRHQCISPNTEFDLQAFYHRLHCLNKLKLIKPILKEELQKTSVASMISQKGRLAF